MLGQLRRSSDPIRGKLRTQIGKKAYHAFVDG